MHQRLKSILPLALGLLLGLPSGCFLLDTKPKHFVDDVDVRQNQLLYREGVILHSALETYMARHQESAPDTVGWMHAIANPAYIPGGRFPTNPWTTTHDTWDGEGIRQNPVNCLGCPLGTIYDGATPFGTGLGPGLMPGTGPMTCRTYGVFIYSSTHSGLDYVLYGIGHHQGEAFVRFQATPSGNCCE